MAGTIIKTFDEKFADFMKYHKIKDYAFVGIEDNNDIIGLWLAGEGKNIAVDRKQADILVSEMERLRLDLLIRTSSSSLQATGNN